MEAATVLRRSILALWLVLFCVTIGLVVVTRGAPLIDRQAVVIRGGSMEPTIPLGSLVILRPAAADAIHPRDVVTFQSQNGVLITHRVLRVADLPDGRYLETKGDANTEPDPVLVSAASTIGVVDGALPVAGFLVTYLSVPTGMVSMASLLTMLLLAASLIGDGRPARSRPALAPRVQPRPS